MTNNITNRFIITASVGTVTSVSRIQLNHSIIINSTLGLHYETRTRHSSDYKLYTEQHRNTRCNTNSKTELPLMCTVQRTSHLGRAD